MKISLTEIMEQNDRDAAKCVATQARKAPTPVLRYPPRPEGVIKLKDMTPATPEEIEERLAPFRKVVEEGQYQRIRWYDHTGKQRSMMLDITTAGMVVSVAGKITPENLAQLCALEPPRIIQLVFKALK